MRWIKIKDSQAHFPLWPKFDAFMERNESLIIALAVFMSGGAALMVGLYFIAQR